MNHNCLKLVLVSTPIGSLGSGKGGGVELTIISLIKAFLTFGHQITLVVPSGSKLPFESDCLQIVFVDGIDQPSWQHQKSNSEIIIPVDAVLPKLWERLFN